MIRGNINSRRVKQYGFGETTLLFRDAGEALQLLGIDDGEIRTSLRSVIQEDGLDELTSGYRESEGDLGGSPYCLDVRDLLLDETD